LRILAIETSCDETAAAVVEDGRRVLSSKIYSQIEEHRIFGGVVPEIASRRHVECITPITRAALEDAKLDLADIDAIAVTHTPGLIGALLVGVNFAKGLSFALEKPLIPVNHIRGHIAAAYITFPKLEPPFLCLVVSGGHCNIVEVISYTSFRVIGKTRDDAPGEAFDKAARVLGLGYPGGSAMDKAAKLGDHSRFPLPRPKVEDSPYDFSFSGLKTAVVNIAHNASQKGESLQTEDIAASFCNTVAHILADKLFAAAKEFGHTRLACVGGVAANSQLRSLLAQYAERDSLKLFLPSFDLCGDNAAMIAAQGYYEFLAGNISDMTLNAYASS